MANIKTDPIEYWEKYASKHLKGRKITEVRYLTTKEKKGLGWNYKSVVMFLDDGSILFPSRDDEGNDGGALFGKDPDGEDLTFPVIS